MVCSFGLALAQESSPQTLPWQIGPTEAKLGDQARLKVPQGYRFLGASETQRLLKQMGNFPSGSELGLITSAAEGEQWFMVVRYIDAGYVKDDEAANWDADALMASIKEGTEEDNKTRQSQGFPPLVIRGWEEKPHYDKQANKVVWDISAQERESSVGVNYNTLALGRQGYLSMNMVGSLEQLPLLKPHVGLLLSNVEFIEGKRYADFDSTTDKVAAVGLSKPRNQRFEGLQLDEELRQRDADPWCGVQIVSLANGDVLNWIRFEGDISEIFDISFLPNVRNPMMIGLRTTEIRDLITFESDIPAEVPAA